MNHIYGLSVDRDHDRRQLEVPQTMTWMSTRRMTMRRTMTVALAAIAVLLASFVGAVALLGNEEASADSEPNFDAPPYGKLISLWPVDVSNNVLRHRFGRAMVSPRWADTLVYADASFVWQPAINGRPGCGSLESFNFPHHFLRHRNYEVWLDPFADESLYRDDATWCPQIRPGGIGLESSNYPGLYMRHADTLYRIEGGGGDFFGNSTFIWQYN